MYLSSQKDNKSRFSNSILPIIDNKSSKRSNPLKKNGKIRRHSNLIQLDGRKNIKRYKKKGKTTINEKTNFSIKDLLKL